MAHKGRQYKLWWRRDAAWNLDNFNFGFPEAYRIDSMGEITSARYAVSQMGKVDAVNLNKSYTRTWTSPPFGGFFDNAYWLIEINEPPDEKFTKVKFGIWHDAVIDHPLYSVTHRVELVATDYFAIFLLGVVQVHFISPDIQVNPDKFFVSIRGCDYARYNP